MCNSLIFAKRICNYAKNRFKEIYLNLRNFTIQISLKFFCNVGQLIHHIFSRALNVGLLKRSIGLELWVEDFECLFNASL